MRDNLSPEEKLLRLIRKDKKPDSIVATGVLAAEASVKSGRVVKTPSSRPLFSFMVNGQNVARSLFFMACLYSVYCFLNPLFAAKDMKGLGDSALSQEDKIKPLPTLKSYDFYQQGAQGHELFAALAVSESAVPQTKDLNLDLIKDLSLVGVLSGDIPQAIIQNKKDQKTFYVAKNGFMGEFQVEEIAEGKVVLGYHGQKYELFL